jgi:hypothetical protein
MDPTEIELAKIGAETAVAPLRDVINRLFGPWADELGSLMAEPIRVWRYSRSLKLFEKVSRIAASRGIPLKAVPLKTILPILEYASVEENDDLHDRWANLLASAAIDANIVRPFFPDALRQLGTTEARLLDYLHDVDAESSKRSFSNLRDLQTEDYAIHSFAKVLDAFERILGALPRIGMIQPNTGNCLAALDVLIALGLATIIPNPNVVSPTGFSYRTTALGQEFVEVCQCRVKARSAGVPGETVESISDYLYHEALRRCGGSLCAASRPKSDTTIELVLQDASRNRVVGTFTTDMTKVQLDSELDSVFERLDSEQARHTKSV